MYYFTNYCHTTLLRTLYVSLLNSRLHYGLTSCCGIFKKLIDRLRVIQSYFIRTILKKPKRYNSFHLYYELNVLPTPTDVCVYSANAITLQVVIAVIILWLTLQVVFKREIQGYPQGEQNPFHKHSFRYLGHKLFN